MDMLQSTNSAKTAIDAASMTIAIVVEVVFHVTVVPAIVANHIKVGCFIRKSPPWACFQSQSTWRTTTRHHS